MPQQTPDPFILALNHTQYAEAAAIPPIIMLLRGGKPVRFLSDWNFLLVPGLNWALRRFEVIPVTSKLARPRYLTLLRKHLVKGPAGMEGALQSLQEGVSLGVFPEGRATGDTAFVHRGHRGAALLALKSGAPVIPAGIRFPKSVPGRPLPVLAPLELHIGEPIRAAAAGPSFSDVEVAGLHAEIMGAIATLAQKQWKPTAPGGTS